MHTGPQGQKAYSPKVDEGLYSRQIYVMGSDAMKRMMRSHVLLVGLARIGTEVAKNICLAGVKNVTLFDPSPVSPEDLSTAFYCSEADVGDRTDKSAEHRIRALNQDVAVFVVPSEPEDFSCFTAVVACDRNLSEQLRLNEKCRKYGVPFVAARARGLFFQIFCDFGDTFVTTDENGEDAFVGVIKSITSKGEVTLAEEERHGLDDGDEIEVKLPAPKTYTVTDCRAFRFSIEGYTGETLGGCPFVQKKKHVVLSFKSLKDSSLAPMMPSLFDGAELIHRCFMLIDSAEKTQGSTFVQDAAGSEKEKEIAAKFLVQPWSTIAPICSIAGGMAAHEVLKACSMKFRPLQQYFYYYADIPVEEVPNSPLGLPNKETSTPKSHTTLHGTDSTHGTDAANINATGTASTSSSASSASSTSSTSSGGTASNYMPAPSRYSPLFQIFGHHASRVFDMSTFIVGAGAIGCEHLKNLALLGAGRNGSITVTDMDAIEKSNLNRQFLFREADISLMKSTVAAREAVVLNPDMAQRIKAYTTRAAKDSEGIFNDGFYDSIDVILNALDNVDARLYMDSRSIYHAVPMVDSGTLGTKGHTQIVLPFATETYGSTEDPQEKSIPLCTIRNFPNLPVHCVEWALSEFKGLFTERITELRAALSGSREELSENSKRTLRSMPENSNEALKEAIKLFYDRFYRAPEMLLKTFPTNHITDEGTPFWAPPKRMPTPIALDPGNEKHRSFVRSAHALICRTFGVQPGPWTWTEALELMHQAVTEVEAEHKGAAPEKGQAEIEAKLQEEEFEKDSETNGHIDFIASAANIRCDNYGIHCLSPLEVKKIAGRIIPAIATTTSVVSGLAIVEALKCIMAPSMKLGAHRNTYVSLALPLLAGSEPVPPRTHSVSLPSKTLSVTAWDRIELPDAPLGHMIEYLSRIWEVEIPTVMHDLTMLYCSFYGANRFKENLKKKVSQILFPDGIPHGVHSVRIDAVVEDKQGNDLPVPFIKVLFKWTKGKVEGLN